MLRNVFSDMQQRTLASRFRFVVLGEKVTAHTTRESHDMDALDGNYTGVQRGRKWGGEVVRWWVWEQMRGDIISDCHNFIFM